MILAYLDTCVWCRPFDDQMQSRICNETAAFYEIALRADIREIEILCSSALTAEIEDISDENKRENVRLLVIRGSTKSVELDEVVKELAKDIEEKCGTSGGCAEYFITTDDKVLKKTKCIRNEFNIKVVNPIDFVREKYGIDI